MASPNESAILRYLVPIVARFSGHLQYLSSHEPSQVGLASVGNGTVKTCRSLRELDCQGAVLLLFILFLGGRSQLAVELLRGGEPMLRTRGMIVPRSVYIVRRPRGSYIVPPIAVSGGGHAGK